MNAIAPGLVYTPMVAPRMDDDLRQYRRNSAPMQVEGTGWDIGYAALFLGVGRGSVDHGDSAAGGRRAVRGAHGNVLAHEPADAVLV